MPLRRGTLLYAPLVRSVLLVNGAALDCAAAASRGAPLPPSLAALGPMFAAPARVPRVRAGPCDPPSLGLITTRNCDMDCIYCDFRARPGVMAEGVAFRALEWMADRRERRGGKRLEVHLFGGEPFLPMDLVKRIVARAHLLARQRGLEATFAACTNGTLAEEDARWVADNFEVITLSLDGPPEIQDRQRPMRGGCGSSRQVERTARILSEGPCRLTLRMCVTARAVPRLEAAVRWLTGRFAPSTVVIEPVRGSCLPPGVEPPEPAAFVRGFAAAARHLAAHGVEAVHSAARLTDVNASFCPVGNDGFLVDTDGRIGACYLPEQEWLSRGLDLTYGRISPAGAVELREQDLARIRRVTADRRQRCRTCFCRWHCAGGCLVAAAVPPGEHSDSCRQTRAITLWQLLRQLELHEEAQHLLEHPLVRGDGLLV